VIRKWRWKLCEVVNYLAEPAAQMKVDGNDANWQEYCEALDGKHVEYCAEHCKHVLCIVHAYGF
jgi:hypothetical protein